MKLDQIQKIIQEIVLIHIQSYSNHDYLFLDAELTMMIIPNTNKDLEHFEQEFSIEHILGSIKKLKEQVKNLESKQPYQNVTPLPI